MNRLLLFIKNNKVQILLMAVIVLAAHGEKITSPTIGIDTEKIIDTKEELYQSWLGIGRQGLVWLKKIMGDWPYNSYITAAATLLFMVIAYMAFAYLFEYLLSRKAGGEHDPQAMGRKRWFSLLFGAIVVAHPVMTEQLYFSLQSTEIAISFTLTALCLLLAHFWAENKKIWGFVLAAGIMQIIFSVYQAFVPLYLLGNVVMMFLVVIGEREFSLKEQIIYGVRLAAVFLAGFIINQVITYAYFNESTYLSDQIIWKEEGISRGIREIWYHVRDTVAGGGVFYLRMFFWLSLLLFLVFLLYIRHIPGTGRRGYILLLLAAVYAGPFYMTILMGMRPVIRAQLALPFTMGIMAFLAGTLLSEIPELRDASERGLGKKKMVWLMAGVYVIGLLTILQELERTDTLYYADEIRYQEDCETARDLGREIVSITGTTDYTGAVAFIGSKKAVLNSACVVGDVIGSSFFAWDTAVEPVNYWSSMRILGFMHCLGYGYTLPTTKEVEAAAEYAAQMPCYPEAGSVAFYDGMIVVKLSE